MTSTTTTTTDLLGETGSPSMGWGVPLEHPLVGLVARMRTRLLGELPPVLWSMTDEELTELLRDLPAEMLRTALEPLSKPRPVHQGRLR